MRLLLFALAGALALLAVAHRAAPAWAPSPALRVTTAHAGVTEVRDASGRLRARFEHLPGAAVRVAELPSGALAAVADRAPGGDRSWGSSLLVARDGGDGAVRCDRVFYASTPHVAPDGRVLVERGRPGPDVPGRMRIDALTLDLIDPGSGQAQTIHATSGFEAYVAAVVGHEAIVYLVQPELASLRAIDLASGAERVLVPSLPPFAHDFTVDGNTLLVHDRDEHDRERETLERVDLASGARTRVQTW
jgi:hypothetical protein